MILNPSVTHAQALTFSVARDLTGYWRVIPQDHEKHALAYNLRGERTPEVQSFRDMVAQKVRKYRRAIAGGAK